MELTLKEMDQYCQSLLTSLNKKQIVLLSGDLGAGKTTLVQSFVRALGGRGALSPTFSLINEYPTDSGSVFHVDLYRLEGDEDLESTGFWDLFDQDQALIFIEWPEKMKINQLPWDWSQWKISIEKPAQDIKRSYTFNISTGS